MGQVLHGSATTTYAIRAAIQRSKASIQALSERHGINPKTVAKWRKRASPEDCPMGPKVPHSTSGAVHSRAYGHFSSCAARVGVYPLIAGYEQIGFPLGHRSDGLYCRARGEKFRRSCNAIDHDDEFAEVACEVRRVLKRTGKFSIFVAIR